MKEQDLYEDNSETDQDSSADEDQDLNVDVFATRRTYTKYRLAKSLRDGQSAGFFPKLHLVAVFYIVAVITFVVRAVLLSMDKDWSCFEVVASICFAVHYVAVGVVLPRCAASIGKGRPIRRMVTVRAKYPDCQGTSIMTFVSVAARVSPIVVLFGFAAPILSLWQLKTEEAGRDGIYEFSPLTLASTTCILLWILGMMFFGPAKIEEAALDASMVAIRGVIGDITHPPAFAQDFRSDNKYGKDEEGAATASFVELVDWDLIARKYRCLDSLLEALWALDNVGGLWATRIVTLFFWSIALGAVGMGHPDAVLRWVYRAFGVIFAAGGAFLLMRLAAVTALCEATGARSGSILSAVQQYVGKTQGASLQQMLKFQNLLIYVQHNGMGIEVYGVAITYSLVLRTVQTLCFYVPLIFTVLEQFFYPHASEKHSH